MKRGAFFMLVSTFLFALVSVGVKLSSSAGMSDGMIVFFRNAGALAALVPFILPGGAAGLKTQRIGPHLMRSLFGLLSMYCTFYALARMPIGDAMLLAYTSPLFMPWMAALWLKEPVAPGSGWAAALGFLGAAFVMKPGAGMFSPVAFTALGAGLFGATAQVGIHDLTKTEPVRRIVFYFSAVSTIVSAVPLAWTWTTPSLRDLALLCGTGVVAGAAQVFLTKAHRQAEPSRIGPFVYAAVLFSAAWDWIIWRHRPGLSFLAGAALVVLAGATILRKGAAPTAHPS